MRTFYLSFITLMIFTSCKQSPINRSVQIKDSLAKQKLARQDYWKKVLAHAQKDRAVNNVIEISKDTVILIKASRGLALSVNAGKTWEWIAREMYFYDLVVDHKNVLWHLVIAPQHRTAYSYIERSDDLGKSWRRTEFNANVFWPIKIYSKDHQPLSVYANGKVFQLSGNDPAHNWQFIKKLNEPFSKSVGIGADSVDNHDNQHIKLLHKQRSGNADTIAYFKAAIHIDEIVRIKDTLYVCGSKCRSNCNSYRVYFATVINKKVKEYPFTESYAYLRKTSFNRIWVLTSSGAYLKSGQKFIHIYK